MSISVPRRYWAGNWESYQVTVHQQLSDVSDFDQSCGLWWEVADTDGEHVLEEGNTKLQHQILLIGIIRSSYDNVLRWMSWDLSEDKSTLVQVMAWCRQATSHYLSQCWPRSVSPYGIIRAQWVNGKKNYVHRKHNSCPDANFVSTLVWGSNWKYINIWDNQMGWQHGDIWSNSGQYQLRPRKSQGHDI